VYMRVHAPMATKTITITITEDAYNKLKMRTSGGGSFSEVINRTMPYTDWAGFIGVLSEKSAKKLKASVLQGDSEMEEHLGSISGKLAGLKG
jgi:predicted CopG family antitoxin